MVDRSRGVRCLFSARIERRDGSYVVEVPDRELDLGALAEDEVYQIGVFAHPDAAGGQGARDAGGPSSMPDDRGGSPRADQSAHPGPPVAEGERRTVTIEGVGEEGDGIAKVDRGYVLIVPGTEPGEQVDVEVTKTTENVGFAEVVGPSTG